MMNNDNLDKFLSLLKNDYTLEKVLHSISDSAAYLFFFENIKNENVKNKIYSTERNAKIFFDHLVNVNDDNLFNKYVISEMVNFIPIEKLRAELLKRPENTIFKDFMKSYDKPKNITDILKQLIIYYPNMSLVKDVIKNNKEKIKKLKTINNEHGRSWPLLKDLFKKSCNNVDDFIELFDLLGIQINETKIPFESDDYLKLLEYSRYSKKLLNKNNIDKILFWLNEKYPPISKENKIEQSKVIYSLFSNGINNIISLLEFTYVDDNDGNGLDLYKVWLNIKPLLIEHFSKKHKVQLDEYSTDKEIIRSITALNFGNITEFKIVNLINNLDIEKKRYEEKELLNVMNKKSNGFIVKKKI